MDSSETFGTARPCLLHNHNHNHLFPCPHALTRHHHHHHFHLYISPHCPIHRFLLQPNTHPKAGPMSIPSPHQPDLQVPKIIETYPSDAMVTQEGNEEMVEEEDEDPVFVLTDEWREFFAKSEAKRRSAKKKAKKKGKAFAET